MRFGFWISAATLAATTTTAFGAGYERTVIWSGKQNGIAGAGAATIHDSQAIYFNPAGLANIDNLEASANFSPTWVQTSGPLTAANQTVDGETSFLPVAGFTAGYKLGQTLGIGFGAYAAGGSRASFAPLDLSAAGFTNKPDVISQLTMMEYSLGVGYQILPGLKVGAAWRIAHVTGTVHSLAVVGSNLVAVRYDNLHDTRYNGFRFGAQYDGDGWGLGAVVRTAVGFTLSGDLSGTFQPSGGAEVPLTGTNGTVWNALPVEGTLGGYYDFMERTLRLVGEYAYANYAQDTQVTATGSLTGGGGAVNITPTSLQQHWKDLHMGRIGLEYRGIQSTVLRVGYAIASDVTPKSYARATFSAPGIGHTLALGAGHSFLSDHLDFDGALEYSFASGSVAASDVPAGATTLPGDYPTHAYGIHLGATYRF